MNERSYLIKPDGDFWYYEDIAKEIEQRAPHMKGKHIFEQMAEIGATQLFNQCDSPHSLPYTFY